MAKTFIVTMRFHAEDDMDAKDLENQIYAETEDANFSFDIASVVEEQAS